MEGFMPKLSIRSRRLAGVAAIAIAAAIPLAAKPHQQRALPAQAIAMPTAEQWAQDLDVLSVELPKRHKNLFFRISQAEFENSVLRFKAVLPTLPPDEIIVGFKKIVASIGDAHTTFGYRTRAALPLMTSWFDDGIWITNTVSPFDPLLNSRIMAIDGRRVEDDVAALAALIPHENEAQVRNQVPGLLTDPLLLHGLKLIGEADSARLTVRDAGGAEKTIKMKAAPMTTRPAWLIDVNDEAGAPLYLRNRRRFYWFEILPESKTLYFKYNSCQEEAGRSFAAFVQEMFSAAASNAVEKIVVDLRHNGGGNSAIFRPFLNEMKKHESLNSKGRVFIIIGRRTFSSAILNALEMKKETAALFVGEPTGGKPNHYGEVQSFKLPNSGIAVTYSVKYFKEVEGDPATIEPDLRVSLAFADYRDKKDPVLDAVLAYGR
jgi:hypothetical protein